MESGKRMVLCCKDAFLYVIFLSLCSSVSRTHASDALNHNNNSRLSRCFRTLSISKSHPHEEPFSSKNPASSIGREIITSKKVKRTRKTNISTNSRNWVMNEWSAYMICLVLNAWKLKGTPENPLNLKLCSLMRRNLHLYFFSELIF